MKKLKKLTALLLIGILTIGETAFAQKGITVDQDMSSDLVRIAVDIGEPQKSVVVTLKVVDSLGEVNYFDMDYTDENGKTDFSYYNDNASGIMKVTAAAQNELIETEYMKLGAQETSEIVRVINEQLESAVPNGNAVKQVFKKYMDGLNMDKTVFQSLKNRDSVYEIIIKDSGNKGKVQSLSDVVRVFYQAVAMEAFREEPMRIYELLESPDYLAVFGENTLLAVELNKLSEKVKAYAVTKIPQDNTRFSTMKDSLELAFMSGRILHAQHWNDVKDTLTDYRSKLGITLGNTDSSVYKNMTGKEYRSYAECAQAFETLKNKNSGTSSSSGGGGSSSGGKQDSNTGIVSLGKPPVSNGESNVGNIEQNSDLQKGKPEFKDMEDAKWAIQAVRYIQEKGIVSGVDDERFEPNRSITRAEAVKMMAAMIGAEPQNAPLPFQDVSEGDWSYPYISAAYRLGLVNGKSETEFDAHSAITRQEMAVMAYRAMDIMRMKIDKSEGGFFEDESQIAPWSAEAVNALATMKIIVGSEGENGSIFRPNDNITRAETSMILYLILKKAE